MRLLLLLLFLSTVLANAQENTAINVGLKGGAHFYNLFAKNTSDNEPFTGTRGVSGYGGLFAEILLKNRLFLNSELIYSDAERIGLIQSVTHVRYLFDDRWSLGLGPQVDFLLNTKGVFEEEEFVLRKNAFSVDFGVQYEFKNNMFFEARYAIGLTSLEDYSIVTDEPSKTRLNSLRFGLGYIF